MSKTEGKIIDLTEKVEAKVTKKGAELTTNSWVEGEIITLHPSLADDFVKKGLITIQTKK